MLFLGEGLMYLGEFWSRNIFWCMSDIEGGMLE